MASSTSFEDTDSGMQTIIDEIEKEGGFVDIGIQPDEEETLLIIAAANEFGTKNIPARPYIRATIDGNEEMFLKYAEELSNDIISGKMTKFQALQLMGQMIEGEIKRTIINLRTPKNAPLTIKRKGSDNPLVDKGFLGGAIRYEVKSGEA